MSRTCTNTNFKILMRALHKCFKAGQGIKQIGRIHEWCRGIETRETRWKRGGKLEPGILRGPLGVWKEVPCWGTRGSGHGLEKATSAPSTHLKVPLPPWGHVALQAPKIEGQTWGRSRPVKEARRTPGGRGIAIRRGGIPS